MPRTRGPRPFYRPGDVIESLIGYHCRYVIMETLTFENTYLLDIADPEKRTPWSHTHETFWKVNNPHNYKLISNCNKLWRQLNEIL